MDSQIFRGYYACLDRALDIVPLDKVYLFNFTRRKDVHSVSIALRNNSEEDRELIDQLAGFKVSRHLYEYDGGRVGVIGLDLVDHETDYVRVYASQHHNWQPGSTEWLYAAGYYLDKSGKVLGKKEYRANTNTGILNIDYFDESDSLINNDKEILCDPEDYKVWNGPRGLFDAIKQHNLRYSLNKKTEKDQAYFLVSPSTAY